MLVHVPTHQALVQTHQALVLTHQALAQEREKEEGAALPVKEMVGRNPTGCHLIIKHKLKMPLNTQK
jgi:hypothetical protein